MNLAKEVNVMVVKNFYCNTMGMKDNNGKLCISMASNDLPHDQLSINVYGKEIKITKEDIYRIIDASLEGHTIWMISIETLVISKFLMLLE